MMFLSREKGTELITCIILSASHLHLHHLVFALWAEGPLVGQGIMVVSAFVAI